MNKGCPLIYACEGGRADIVRLLLEHGVEVNVHAERDGRTALHYTIDNGATCTAITCDNNKIAIVRLLLEHGAEVNVHAERDGITPFMLACRTKNQELMQLLLDHGADIDGCDWFMYTSLVESFRYHLGNEQFLLSHGADVNCRDKFGRTPLALFHDEPDVIHLLLEHGADPSLTDDNGMVALDKFIDEDIDNDDVIDLVTSH